MELKILVMCSEETRMIVSKFLPGIVDVRY
jgi:hypothetical protein